MRHLLLTTTAFALLLASGTASAAYVHQDYATSGDGLTTLDQSTGIEWLKLSATKGMSLNQVAAEMGAGGRFDGWRFPTGEEVESMIVGMFPSLVFKNTEPDSPTTLSSSFHYGAYATSWYTWMGKPDYGSGYNTSFGLYYQTVNGADKILMTGFNNVNSKVNIYEDYYGASYSNSYIGGSGFGVFLVKGDGGPVVPPTDGDIITPPSDVSSPFAAAFLGLASMILGWRRKATQRG